MAAKNIDWSATVARLKPQFAACSSDLEHVRNVMELLACLRDSHTGVTRSSVGWEGLPTRFDGLYGGALWFGQDHGRFVLRGLRAGHALADQIAGGATLVSIGGLPAWLVLDRERQRIERYSGSSSAHSLWASLSNRMLPFHDAKRLALGFVLPAGDLRNVEVAPWSADGKAFYATDVELPDGLQAAEGAVSTWLDVPWSKRTGYLRITGKMDAATAERFHAALDALSGLDALLLDCRSMGGGGDGPAWEMAGRFFAKGVANGRNGVIDKSGAWQFDGPIVMLQDETMVSSAETFTWAMRETDRAITVGRPTGGWGIIPKVFQCPSGLLDFRLGVNDRKTPIGGLHTEGIGFAPDVLLPFGPEFSAEPDPARSIALELLSLLHAGCEREKVRDAFHELFEGDVDGFRKAADVFGKQAHGYTGERLAERVREDLRGELSLERAALDIEEDAGLPDLIGLELRLPRLLARAKAAGLGAPAAALKKAHVALAKEQKAQAALLELDRSADRLDHKAQQSFLSRHGKTRVGQLAGRLWR